MAKQSSGQKETVERVMHEFKHGELEGAGGRKVRSRKQAIAIALHEAGLSNQETPAKNRANLKKTKAKERKGETGQSRSETGPTRAELYARAKAKNVQGRSKMSKAELEKALG